MELGAKLVTRDKGSSLVPPPRQHFIVNCNLASVACSMMKGGREGSRHNAKGGVRGRGRGAKGDGWRCGEALSTTRGIAVESLPYEESMPLCGRKVQGSEFPHAYANHGHSIEWAFAHKTKTINDSW
jgi:hypothetical protein